MILQPADLQRKRGRPAPLEHPNRRVRPGASYCTVFVQDEPDAPEYRVTFATPEMRDRFFRKAALASRFLARRFGES